MLLFIIFNNNVILSSLLAVGALVPGVLEEEARGGSEPHHRLRPRLGLVHGAHADQDAHGLPSARHTRQGRDSGLRVEGKTNPEDALRFSILWFRKVLEEKHSFNLVSFVPKASS